MPCYLCCWMGWAFSWLRSLLSRLAGFALLHLKSLSAPEVLQQLVASRGFGNLCCPGAADILLWIFYNKGFG